MKGTARTFASSGLLLQCFQIFDEVRLLRIIKAKLELRIIVIDHGEQVGCAAVVEVRRMLPERTQRRRPILLGGGAVGIGRVGSDLERRVQEWTGGTGSAEHTGEQRRLVAPCASAGTVEHLLTALRCRGVETSFGRRGRRQSELIL